MSTPKHVTVVLAKEKPTKNTVRYAEVVAEGEVAPLIGVVYLQNHTVKELGNPDEITVVVHAGRLA